MEKTAFPNIRQAFVIMLAIPAVQLLEKGLVLASDALFHTSWQQEPLIVLVTSLTAPIPIILGVLLWGKPPPPNRKHRHWTLRFILIAGMLLTTLGLALMAAVYFQWVNTFFPRLEVWDRFRGFTTPRPSPAVAWSIILIPPLTLPFFEEWLFRGIILRGLLQHYRPFMAILLSSLLFLCSHVSIGNGLMAFTFSLMWGWYYYHTRSLFLCTTSHIFSNILALILSIIEKSRPDDAILDSWLGWGLILLLVGILPLWIIFRFSTDKNHASPTCTAEA